jgi:hypothetical protein
VATESRVTNLEGTECRVYLAPSTIPGAGLGVFAGVAFRVDDMVLFGDIAVPIDELPFHTGSNDPLELSEFFLWQDYSWDSSIASGINYDYRGVDELGEGDILLDVELASFGLGAMPNCKFGFVNIHSNHLLDDNANLDRSSPGNGAFTPFHERRGYAMAAIPAGAEIFEVG